MRLFIGLSITSLIISAGLKYLAPNLVDLELLPNLRMQAIAISTVSLPVVCFAILVWGESK
jgi:hypothetical protein